MNKSMLLMIVLVMFMGVEGTTAQAVKKSSSGICHCVGGSYYEKTKNFTPFDTIKACLDSGGREPKRGQGDCSKATPQTPASKSPKTQPKAEAAPGVKPVVSVIDGDTIVVAGERIRFQGIDAPELKQRCRDAAGASYLCGKVATQALRKRIGAGPVRCEVSGRDRYGRSLATCYAADGGDLEAWLVRRGHALAYRRYSMRYVREEEAARKARAGMHAGTFVPPWDWRRGSR